MMKRGRLRCDHISRSVKTAKWRKVQTAATTRSPLRWLWIPLPATTRQVLTGKYTVQPSPRHQTTHSGSMPCPRTNNAIKKSTSPSPTRALWSTVSAAAVAVTCRAHVALEHVSTARHGTLITPLLARDFGNAACAGNEVTTPANVAAAAHRTGTTHATCATGQAISKKNVRPCGVSGVDPRRWGN